MRLTERMFRLEMLQNCDYMTSFIFRWKVFLEFRVLGRANLAFMRNSGWCPSDWFDNQQSWDDTKSYGVSRTIMNTLKIPYERAESAVSGDGLLRRRFKMTVGNIISLV